MRIFGLIGYPLSHSFSKKYFSDKFKREGIEGAEYDLFEIKEAEQLKGVLKDKPDICGLNVTIPHKQAVIPLLDELDEPVKKIEAVNVIKVMPDGKLKGYNSDYFGFRKSLLDFIPEKYDGKALILGTGGASKAVKVALEDLGIPYRYVSRTASEDVLQYSQLDHEIIADYRLIINTTPLGMYPEVKGAPEIPYEYLSSEHYLFDLVYNPEQTLFMQKAAKAGARTKNGMEMLILQAEKAWEIWNS